jgi:hypothetical protein
MMRKSIFLFMFATLAFTSACKTQAPPPEAAASHRYSPFVLKVSGESRFDTISFKDVGVKPRAGEDHERFYEVMAESLSLELSTEAPGALSAEVQYSEEITDPKNHKSCGSKHIYVDVWSTEAPPRWGYSLWSGCEEESQFVWRELPRASGEDPSTEVGALTQDIAASLRKARETSCFVRGC